MILFLFLSYMAVILSLGTIVSATDDLLSSTWRRSLRDELKEFDEKMQHFRNCDVISPEPELKEKQKILEELNTAHQKASIELEEDGRHMDHLEAVAEASFYHPSPVVRWLDRSLGSQQNQYMF